MNRALPFGILCAVLIAGVLALWHFGVLDGLMTKDTPSQQPSPSAEANKPATLSAHAKDVMERAASAYNSGDYLQAAILYAEAEGESPDAALGVGLSYYMLGDYEAATAHLEQAAARGADQFTAHKYLALALNQKGLKSESAAHLDKALAIQSDAELLALRQEIRTSQKSSAPSIPTLTNMLSAMKSQETQNESLQKGIEAYNKKDFLKAHEYFSEALATEPEANFYLGANYFALNDFQNAVPFLEKSLQLTDTGFHPMAMKYLAFSYYNLSEVTKGLAYARAAMKQINDPNLNELARRLEREVSTTENQVSESSDHFKSIYDGYQFSSINRKVLSMLEDAYADIGKALDYYPSNTIIVVLNSNEEFQKIYSLPSYVSGVFDGKIRLPIKGMDKLDDASIRQTMYHEYTHAVLAMLTRNNMPLWYNEGIAEYFSEPALREPEMKIPLRDMERNMLFQSAQMTQSAYRESHNAVAYLFKQHGGYAIKESLLQLGSGATFNDAFSTSFGISYDEFLTKWSKQR